MATYETSGTLVTSTKQADGKAYEVTPTATISTNTSVSLTVHEDTSGGTTADYTETISIADGTNTYSLSNFTSSQGATYWLTLDLSTSDDSTTPSVDEVTLTVGKYLLRFTDFYGSGTIDSTRQLSKQRNSDVYGNGTIDSTRQVTKPRNSDVYGNGAIDNQIIGFIDTAVVTSHVSPIHSFVENERTSLELLDFDLTYDEQERAWYTQWMPENKITGNENNIALISDVAPQGKEPAARIIVQYSTDKRNVTDEATPVYVDSDELVREITGLPSTEDGYYRLKIDQYSGYNDITNINMGLVH